MPPKKTKKSLYHSNEAKRIRLILKNLDPSFSKNGIVRTVLKMRIQQEKTRARKNLKPKQL